MAFAYTKLADLITDQNWGKIEVNKLRENYRYVEEDIFGDPSINSDRLKSIKLNGSGHAGRIGFDGDTAKYFGVNAGLTDFEVSGLDMRIGSTNYSQSDLIAFRSSGGTMQSGSNSGATDRGVVLPRAGVVIAFSVHYYHVSWTSDRNYRPDFLKNGSILFSLSSQNFTVGTVGTRVTSVTTFTPGDHVLSSGSRINISETVTGGGAGVTLNKQAFLLIQLIT